MKVNIQSVNFNAADDLKNHIDKRIKKLEVFFSDIIDADVYLKVENTSDKENKIAEIRLHVPGENMVAKKQCRSFEEAIDLVVHALERMIKRWKKKKID